MQRDCSVFPAYTDYLYGVDLRPEVAEEPGLHPLLYLPQHLEPIRYTNSMPSRSMLYTRAPNVPHHMDATGTERVERRMGLTARTDDGPLARDLRSPPACPNRVEVIPSGTAVLMPQSASRPAAATPSQKGAVPSADSTRQKPLNAPHKQAPTVGPRSQSSSRQLARNLRQQAVSNGSPEQRRNPRHQATHPSSVRSSSATDVDSHIGHMPPSTTPMLSSLSSPIPRSEHPGYPQNSQQQLPDWLTSPASKCQEPERSPPKIPILHPGDLLTDPRYAAAPIEHIRSINDTVTQLWSIAQHHPDSMCKKQALSQLQGESLRAQCMLQKWERDAQRAAQAHAQTSAYVSPEIQESFAHPQELPNKYGEQVLIPQQFPVHSHEPLHNYSKQLSSHASFHVQSQQPQRGLPLEQPPPPFQIGETSAKRRIPHLLHHNNAFRLPRSTIPLNNFNSLHPPKTKL